jgi:lysozyme
MAEDLNNLFENFQDKSLEDLGSSLLSRQAEINRQQAKEARKSRRFGQALAILGVGQQIFKNAYKKREKEIEDLKIFELSNNENQSKRIQGMANILNIFDEDQMKTLAGPNQDWATMSLDDRTEAVYKAYGDTLQQALRQPLDAAIEQGNIFDDFAAFKAEKPLYDGVREVATKNIVKHFLENNRYKQLDSELRKLYGAPTDEFMTRAEILEKAMALTPHELTKLERSVFAREKERYRNIGVFRGVKHAFEKIGRKQEENGGINLFREINPDDIYGRIDEVISDLDIAGNMTVSVRKYMTELKGTEQDALVQAKQDQNGQQTISQFVTSFSNNQNTSGSYNEKTPTGELLRMSGRKGRFEDFWEDISQDVTQSGAFITDTLAIQKLMDMKPELAQSIYEAKYEKLYGKPPTETVLQQFRGYMQDNSYKRNFAVMVTAGEGFKVEKAWYERGSEKYDGTGIVGRIEKGYTYDRFSGMLPSLLNEGINTPAESRSGSFEEDENWERLDRENKTIVFDSHYNNIATSPLSDRQKDLLIEDLFANVRHPDNLNPEDYAALYLKQERLEQISRRRGKEPLSVLKQELRETLESERIGKLKIEISKLREENAPTKEVEEAKFKLFQTQLQEDPSQIDEDLGSVIEVLYKEEGLGKRKGKIGSQNTRVYKDSEGFLTAGVGHKLTKEELTQYKEGDTVPVDVVRSWLIKDARTAKNTAVSKLEEIRPDLLDNEEMLAATASFYYQLGKEGGDKFKNMWAAIEAGDGDKAYDEALDSLWYKQTPRRARNFAELLRSYV